MGGFNFNTIWITILLLSVTVVIHEFGHFITARAFGVTVYEFSVGFGPLIGKFNRKGVQYSLRWILFGGFCKIAGMDMALEGETKDPESRPDKLFFNLSLWKKIVVLATGPLLNFVSALVIFFCILVFIGMPNGVQAVKLDSINSGSPAFQAGLKSGDQIISINNSSLKNAGDVSKLIQQSKGNPIQITVSRNGNRITKTISPVYSPENKKYILGVMIGIIPKFEVTSISKALKMTLELPGNTIRMLVMLIKGKLKGSLMGPVGMVDMIDQTMHQSTQLVVFNLLFFACNIGISLFLFNMLPLPLPILDGGWIVILILESIFRREFSAEQKATAYSIGLIALLTATVWITYGDILRLVKRLAGG